MKDSQRNAVYRWEEKVRETFPELKERLTWEQCKSLVAEVWEDYRSGSNPPRVVKGRRNWDARASSWRIVLPEWSWTKCVVLHEVAHVLTQGYQHGPVFATFVTELWHRYVGVPMHDIVEIGKSQKPRRVKFSTMAETPRARKISRKWKQWNLILRDLQKELKEHRESEPKKWEVD